MIWPSPRIVVKMTPGGKGWGVYARRHIAKGETIEVCPVIKVGDDPLAPVSKAPANEWAYHFDDEAVIALGYGSLYNHAWKPNANWDLHDAVPRSQPRTIRHFAIRDIRKGEEITINYLGSPGARGKLDFKVLP